MSCVFCDIASHAQETEILYEDDDVLAFRDIEPKYAVHILLIPKKHIDSASTFSDKDDALVGKLLRQGARLAEREGVAENGFRLLTNVGADAGQTVNHLHVHLLGGEPLRPM